MYMYEVTFVDKETGDKKSITVEAPGIFPAIEKAQAEMMLFGYDIKSAVLLDF